MKSFLYLLGGLAAATAYYLVTNANVTPATRRPVDELAHKLQDAWVDHHTVV